MAVNDEARPQTIIGQLLPDVVRMAIDLRVRAVAEMSRKPRPGSRRVGDLNRSRGGVADGDDDARGGRPFDEINRVGPLGRERGDANPSPGGGLPSLKLVTIGRARVLCRGSGPGAGRWGEETGLA